MKINENKAITMDIEDILDVIVSLSHSQGSYGRLLDRLLDIRENDPFEWENIANMLEGQKFRTPLDVVLFFEG